MLLLLIALLHADVAVANVDERTASLPTHLLTGPYSSLAEMGHEISAVRERKVPITHGSLSPYLDARLIAFNDPGPVSWWLVLRTRRGWFIDRVGNRLWTDAPRDHLFVGGARLDARRGMALLRVGAAVWKRDYHGGLSPEYGCHELLVACTGAETPACTSPMPVADKKECGDADATDGGDFAGRAYEWLIEAEALDDNRLRLRVKHGSPSSKVSVAAGFLSLAVEVGDFRLSAPQK